MKEWENWEVAKDIFSLYLLWAGNCADSHTGEVMRSRDLNECDGVPIIIRIVLSCRFELTMPFFDWEDVTA